MDTRWLSLGGLVPSASHGDAQLKTTTPPMEPMAEPLEPSYNISRGDISRGDISRGERRKSTPRMRG